MKFIDIKTATSSQVDDGDIAMDFIRTNIHHQVLAILHARSTELDIPNNGIDATLVSPQDREGSNPVALILQVNAVSTDDIDFVCRNSTVSPTLSDGCTMVIVSTQCGQIEFRTNSQWRINRNILVGVGGEFAFRRNATVKESDATAGSHINITICNNRHRPFQCHITIRFERNLPFCCIRSICCNARYQP